MREEIPKTLIVFDEAEGVDETSYSLVETWDGKVIYVSCPYDCDGFLRRKENGKRGPSEG